MLLTSISYDHGGQLSVENTRRGSSPLLSLITIRIGTRRWIECIPRLPRARHLASDEEA